MARLHEVIVVPTPIDRAFEYTADFNNIQDWDPGIEKSRQRGEGTIGVGTEFDLTVVFGATRSPMRYRITEFEPPHRVAFVGEGTSLTAVDEIRFEATSAGTKVTYTADLRFNGFMRLAAPFLSGILKGVGRKAVAGLSAALESQT